MTAQHYVEIRQASSTVEVHCTNCPWETTVLTELYRGYRCADFGLYINLLFRMVFE